MIFSFLEHTSYNRRRKRRFINKLIKLVKADIISRVPNMPKEWNRFELREYIAMRFKELTLEHTSYERRKRFRKFKNDVMVLGL